MFRVGSRDKADYPHAVVPEVKQPPEPAPEPVNTYRIQLHDGTRLVESTAYHWSDSGGPLGCYIFTVGGRGQCWELEAVFRIGVEHVVSIEHAGHRCEDPGYWSRRRWEKKP